MSWWVLSLLYKAELVLRFYIEHQVWASPNFFTLTKMMPPGKTAVFLLLVCIMASPDQVISKNPICTKKQREKILEVCDYFIQPGYPIRLVSRDSPCCVAVREVRDRDMECVIMQLTNQEKLKYSVEKIRALHGLCELPPPPPPHNHQVKQLYK